ncbi:MAG: hypothetical protein NZO16_05075 [Deltaproteobacteria bacterium]|nr:hypothetical protein [Deltaproteobacteria bacterium]
MVGLKFLFAVLVTLWASDECFLDEPNKKLEYSANTIGRGAYTFMAWRQSGVHRKIFEIRKLGPDGQIQVTRNVCGLSVDLIRRLIADVALNHFPKNVIVQKVIKTGRRNRQVRNLILKSIKSWERKNALPLSARGFSTSNRGWNWL